jgi:hypothetical protein
MSDDAGEISAVMSEVNLNSDAGQSNSTCAHCAKEGARKRCAKRHTKCLQKLFCDKSCESADHSKKVAVAVVTGETPKEGEAKAPDEAEKALKAKMKKAKKASNAAKKKGDGELWWNNSVYASW